MPSGLPIASLDDNLEEIYITPESFFQINDGKPVTTKKINSIPVAGIFSNNNAIGALVDVAAASESFLLISAIDQKPAPTKLAIYVKSPEGLSEIDWSEGDGQTETIPC